MKLFPSVSRYLLFVYLVVVSVATPVWAGDPAAAGPIHSVKLLTVGNSFAVNATTYLPELAKAGGKELVLLNCYKGGCSLKQHADAIAAIQENPESPQAKIYTHKGALSAPDDKKHPFHLKEALLADKWDVVTIQQYSLISHKPETYEPYARQVVDTIKQYAPQAEIMVFETWSYREDDPLFKGGTFTPQMMYTGLKAAYAKLAATYQLRTIPVGNAFQLARQTALWSFKPDANFDFANATEDQKPNQQGSLNSGWNWGLDQKTGTKKWLLDAHHANRAGQYLGAAVCYEVLFRDDVRKVDFVPQGLTSEEAADLRRIAHETVQAPMPGGVSQLGN